MAGDGGLIAGHILVAHPLAPSHPRRGNDQIMKAGGKGRELFSVTHFAARFAAAEVSHEGEARREAQGGATAGGEREKRGDERNDGLVTFPMLGRMQIALSSGDRAWRVRAGQARLVWPSLDETNYRRALVVQAIGRLLSSRPTSHRPCANAGVAVSPAREGGEKGPLALVGRPFFDDGLGRAGIA